MNFSRIWAVAALNIKLLVRSWRFWILTILALLLSAVIPLYYSLLRFFLSGLSGTVAILHPSFVPYGAHLGVSLVLGLAVVWFAFDAPFRHRKTRTEEVLYAAPLETWELVVGQFLGILVPAAVVATISAGIALGIQAAFRAGVPVVPHIVHLLFQSIPALAVTTAITLCLAVVTRSRVIAGIVGSATIVLAASVLFGWIPMPWEYQQVVDTTGLWSVFFYSDMIGYPFLTTFLFQRLYVFMLVVVMLALAVWLYPRLSGRQGLGKAPLVAATCLVVAVAMGAWWVMGWRSERSAATAAATEQEAWVDAPATHVSHYDMQLDLTGGRDRVTGTVGMTLKNSTPDPRTEWVFLLNSGLEVTSVEGADYERGLTTFVLKTSPVAPGGTHDVKVAYGGKLSDKGLFPGGRFELRDLKTQNRGNLSLLLGVMPYFVTKYAFLPPMSRFYPVPNVDTGYKYPQSRPQNWATVDLDVTLPDGWEMATQGSPTAESSGNRHVWKSEVPVPEVSIYAGPYETYETTVADVAVRLYVHPGHAKAVEFFSEASDEILDRAEKKFKQAQDTTGLEYPYESLNLVEIPMPARAYTDGLDSFAAFHAPGIVALREAGLFTANLKRRLDQRTGNTRVQAQVSVNGETVDESGETVETPTEGEEGAEDGAAPAEGEATEVADAEVGAGTPEGEEADAGDGEAPDDQTQQEVDTITAKADILETFFKYDFVGSSVPHAVVPSMWDYVVQPEGRLHPLLNRGLGGFVSERATGARRNFSVFAMADLQQTMQNVFPAVFGGGMDWDDAAALATVDMDKAYELMTSTPMAELDPTDDTKAYLDVVTVRGHAFFETLEQEIGASSFAESIALLRKQHEWSTYTMDDLQQAVEQVEGEDMDWLFSAWLEGTDLPGFRMLGVDAYRIKTKSPQPKYQVVAHFENPEPVDGYVTLEVRIQGEEEPVSEAVRVPAGKAVEWGVVVQAEPRWFRMSPILAYNRTPSRKGFRGQDWEPREAKEGHPFEGVRDAEFVPWPTGIVVDDADPGFRIEGKSGGFALRFRRSRQDEDELPLYNPWQGAPKSWSRWTTDKGYGRYNPSVAVVRPGQGKSSAIWEADLDAPGDYEVFVYHAGPDLKRGMPKPMQDRNRLGTTYVYRVGASSGEEEIEFDPTRAETGWNSLGTFHFDSGLASVTLRDDVKGGMVWADAVRFVPEGQQARLK